MSGLFQQLVRNEATPGTVFQRPLGMFEQADGWSTDAAPLETVMEVSGSSDRSTGKEQHRHLGDPLPRPAQVAVLPQDTGRTPPAPQQRSKSYASKGPEQTLDTIRVPDVIALLVDPVVKRRGHDLLMDQQPPDGPISLEHRFSSPKAESPEPAFLPTVRRRPETPNANGLERRATSTSNNASPLSEPSGPPIIEITIGRIEVRSPQPQIRAQQPAPFRPAMDLDEYMQRRNKGSS